MLRTHALRLVGDSWQTGFDLNGALIPGVECQEMVCIGGATRECLPHLYKDLDSNNGIHSKNIRLTLSNVPINAGVLCWEITLLPIKDDDEGRHVALYKEGEKVREVLVFRHFYNMVKGIQEDSGYHCTYVTVEIVGKPLKTPERAELGAVLEKAITLLDSCSLSKPDNIRARSQAKEVYNRYARLG